ncbi:hypothetical protein BX600DRAFT_434637 [Xylariales sp. PMI_506]|nr:hypothetical protein BX600DRAFT_434637 [Xylariales sp. PMI_506]
MGQNELWLQSALVLGSSLLFAAITLFAFTTTWAQTASDKRQPLSWHFTLRRSTYANSYKAQTSIVTVYDTAYEYEVTSGIGPFNSSYVDQFVDSLQDPPFSVIPYSYSSVVYNLVTNSLFSTITEPLGCQRSDRDLNCESYILSGGLSMTAPWTPPGNLDHPLVRIANVPSIQVEFLGHSGNISFESSDCVLFGSNETYIAAELCLAAVGGLMHAVIDKDSLFATEQQMKTRSNLTIMGLSELSAPDHIDVSESDVAGYMSALSWLLDYSAANIPAPSSVIEIFWSNQDSLSDTFVDGILLQNFRSVLAFPVWLFNANNYGNTEISGKILNQGLPFEFYTQAAVVAPLVKLKFDPNLLVVFMCLEGIVLVFLWATTLFLLLPWSSEAPVPLSSYPIFDFLFKSWVSWDFDTDRDSLWKADSSQILGHAGGARIYTNQGAREQESRIAFTSTSYTRAKGFL